MAFFSQYFQSNKNLIISLFCFYISLSVFLILFSKTTTFILLNRNAHSLFLDTVFKNITFLGDGIFIILLSLIFVLFRQPKIAACLMLGFLSSGLFIQIIKHFLHLPRPAAVLKNNIAFTYVDGVTYHLSNSFPSGHTTTAFAASTILYTFKRQKNVITSLLFLLSAILIGYSRVYLGQHFPVDILGGAVCGSVWGILSIYIINRFFPDISYRKWNHKNLPENYYPSIE